MQEKLIDERHELRRCSAVERLCFDCLRHERVIWLKGLHDKPLRKDYAIHFRRQKRPKRDSASSMAVRKEKK